MKGHLPQLGLGPAVFLVFCLFLSCGTLPDRDEEKGTNAFTGSKSCRECHERFYNLWAPSLHGLAMQPFTDELAKATFPPQDPGLTIGDILYRFVLEEAGGAILEDSPQGQATYPVEYALGGKNVYYFLTPLEKGRLQVLPIAYDVNEAVWFDTTGSAIRHFADRTDEALDWRHPAYTFNTSCFGCHVSQVSTNYELETQTYHTTWTEPGINCETCHGPAEEHVRVCREASPGTVPEDLKIVITKQFNIEQTNDLCSPCHARGRPLSTKFQPGDRFFDNFDLVTLEHQDFYPDGRDLGENYTHASWLQSPCVQSGELDCLHCHTSSGRFRQKDHPNEACLPCHEERVSDPGEHTHHPADGPGGRCVDCHMPATWFARMKRHDHSMRPPTPAATLAFDSPNACNLCHSERSADWANRRVDSWHGPDSQKLRLEPATLVDAARKQDWERLDEMLTYLKAEGRDEVIAASLIRLLRHCPDERKWSALFSALNAPSPLMRASATEALGDQLTPESVQALGEATRDDFRLVRVRAAAALAPVPLEAIADTARDSVGRATEEFIASLQARPDDAYSHYNLGNFYMNRGQNDRAMNSFETAVQLRPDLVQPLVNLANIYAAQGKKEAAERTLRRALELEPDNASGHFNLGLVLGELGRLSEAAASHRAALEADPELAAAAYNLGVILAPENPEEGLQWCRRAADLRPNQPKYAYTVAYFLEEKGEQEEAIAILKDLTERHPGYVDAWLALSATYKRAGRNEEAQELHRRAGETVALPPALRQQFAQMSRH